MSAALAAFVLLLLQRQAPVMPASGRPSLAITVVEDGTEAPVEGATVTISPVPLGLAPTVLMVKTPEDGRLGIGALAPGTYRVQVAPPDRLAVAAAWFPAGDHQLQPVVLEPGERSNLRFVFKRPPTISGRVTTPDGKPVVAVPVELVTWTARVDGRPVLGPVRTVATDGAGQFVMDRLRPGQYYVRAKPAATAGRAANFAYAPGTASVAQAAPLQLQAGDDLFVGLTLLNTPAAAVSGHVLDANGQPAPNTVVTLVALDRTSRPAAGFTGDSGDVPDLTAPTDRSGQFLFRSVLQGLYAVRAVVRDDARSAVRAAGVLELEVGASDVNGLTIALIPSARMTGRFVFNGAEEPDPTRTQIAMLPVGEHDHLRSNLASSDTWDADGGFEVDGLIGSHRLTLRSSGAWFVERAVLEDGTDISVAPLAFVPGRTYANVRVWLSDRVASVGGPLPAWWEPGTRTSIVAFPEEPSLRVPGSRHVQTATVRTDTARFAILGLPPGQAYLVAAFTTTTFEAPTEELFELLTPLAARVVVDEARPYQITLGPPLKR